MSFKKRNSDEIQEQTLSEGECPKKGEAVEKTREKPDIGLATTCEDVEGDEERKARGEILEEQEKLRSGYAALLGYVNSQSRDQECRSERGQEDERARVTFLNASIVPDLQDFMIVPEFLGMTEELDEQLFIVQRCRNYVIRKDVGKETKKDMLKQIAENIEILTSLHVEHLRLRRELSGMDDVTLEKVGKKGDGEGKKGKNKKRGDRAKKGKKSKKVKKEKK
jgi:hypothetical protein